MQLCRGLPWQLPWLLPWLAVVIAVEVPCKLAIGLPWQSPWLLPRELLWYYHGLSRRVHSTCHGHNHGTCDNPWGCPWQPMARAAARRG